VFDALSFCKKEIILNENVEKKEEPTKKKMKKKKKFDLDDSESSESEISESVEDESEDEDDLSESDIPKILSDESDSHIDEENNEFSLFVPINDSNEPLITKNSKLYLEKILLLTSSTSLLIELLLL
jgi:hypothetical protein